RHPVGRFRLRPRRVDRRRGDHGIFAVVSVFDVGAQTRLCRANGRDTREDRGAHSARPGAQPGGGHRGHSADARAGLNRKPHHRGAMIAASLNTRRTTMDGLFQDLRYGFRQLLRQRGSSLVAVITLALGIGVSTALFSIIDATMLRPLPYPDPEQLVSVNPEETMPDGRVSRATASMEDMRNWQ